MMRRNLAGVLGMSVLAAMILASPLAVRAQEPGEQTAPQGGARGGGQFAGRQSAVGTVVSVTAPNVILKSVENGQTITVVTTTNTRLVKNGGAEPLDLATLKPGDGIMASGQLDAPSKTLHAAMVFSMTPDQTKQMVQAVAEMKANLGKTYITGRVTAVDIDNLKMTVQRPDGEAQTIGFDEGTSFRKGARVTGIGGSGGAAMGGGFGGRRGGNSGGGAPSGGPQAGGNNTPAITGGDSITLADIKVGDNVVGLGSMKSGTFVPSTLSVQERGQIRGRQRGEQGGSGAAAPPATPTGPGLF